MTAPGAGPQDAGRPGVAPRQVLVPHQIATQAPPLGAVHTLEGLTMGTRWSVRLVGAVDLDLGSVERGIRQELDAVVAQMSHWEAGSDLSRFNQAPAGTWHELPAAFFEVLQYALSVAADSGGAFDPAAGALVNLWGFGAQGRHDQPGFQVPDEPAIAAARARGGWQRLHVDAATRRARQPGGLVLDLSAIAKGHAVDRIADHLAALGFVSHLVEVGGELRGTGMKPDGQPWWVHLEHPLAAGPDADTLLALHGVSVATSGDYRRSFEHAGWRHAHSIDPRNGRPIAHGLASVTVWHARCMAADALSTALTVLGPVEGLAWADQRGLAAQFLTRRANGGCNTQVTRAWAELAA